MDTCRFVLLITTIVGSLVTVGGLLAAYIAANKEHAEAGERIERMKTLEAHETRENRAFRSAMKNGTAAEGAPTPVQESEARYATAGLTRPTNENMVYLAAYESDRLMGRVLVATKRDFIVAIAGLVISTAASALSLYLT